MSKSDIPSSNIDIATKLAPTKDWFIVLPDHTELVGFVGISTAALILMLNYRDTVVKVRLHNMSDYRMCISGKEVAALAISKKGEKFNKPIKIVFK